jgi:hypothetical protein
MIRYYEITFPNFITVFYRIMFRIMKELWKFDIHVSEARNLWQLCAIICCASHKIHQTFNCLNTALTVTKYIWVMKRITRLQTSHYKVAMFQNCSMLCAFYGTESEGMNRISRERKRVNKILFIVQKKYSNIMFFIWLQYWNNWLQRIIFEKEVTVCHICIHYICTQIYSTYIKI